MLRKGSRVRIANKQAMRTGAKVRVGEIGKIRSFQSNSKNYAHVVMDNDKTRSPWSIPVEGLEHIKRGG